jgi:quaternary ammonium compound-resistance protein SugE
MAWFYLLAASIVEIAMALLLKSSQGWTRLWPSVLGVAAAGASIFFLTHAVKTLPVGTAYAIWTGIGSVGVTLIGILWMGESASPLRLLCVVLVVAAFHRRGTFAAGWRRLNVEAQAACWMALPETLRLRQ